MRRSTFFNAKDEVMKKISPVMAPVMVMAIAALFSFDAFAQTTTNHHNTATGGSGNVIISNPDSTIGNQVNSPANSNTSNVYVVNPRDGDSRSLERYSGRYRDALDRDELLQRRYEREYDAAMQRHDYRDRPSYYDIRGNQARQRDRDSGPRYRSGYRQNNGSQYYRSNNQSHYRQRRHNR